MVSIDKVSICKLPGHEGSNPEFVGSYPEDSTIIDEPELISKSMPDGVAPGTFRSNRIDNMIILAYTFAMKSEQEGVRDDLASISVVVSDKKVNVDQIEILFKEIMTTLDTSGELYKLRSATLVQMMERIYNGVNKNEKIKISTITVDVPRIIKQKKLNILKRDLKEFQGAF
ncbi:MAG TPA: hypothetical protein VKM55_26020 [Candidatus Lokiarchaeia archaeon]|nr:hypothetical protein [Candidatus Lokiarchaeia archaeon]